MDFSKVFHFEAGQMLFDVLHLFDVVCGDDVIHIYYCDVTSVLRVYKCVYIIVGSQLFEVHRLQFFIEFSEPLASGFQFVQCLSQLEYLVLGNSTQLCFIQDTRQMIWDLHVQFFLFCRLDKS